MKESRVNIAASRAVDFKQLKISSSAFENEQAIPFQYTCDGANNYPPLAIKNIPEQTLCLALIVDDPDAHPQTWVHWLAWNIPVTHFIKENQMHGVQGMNDFNQMGYGGPCPPSGTHHYYFKVYALDALLNLPVSTKKHQLEQAMSEHIIAFGELVGCYTKT